MFDNNYGKCEPIFKIISSTDSQEKSTTEISTSHATCCYTTLWNSKIQKKMLLILAAAAQQTVEMIRQTLW